MTKEMIAIYLYVPFLIYQRVLPQLHHHVSRHHLHHRSHHRPTVIRYRKTEMLRLQYPKGIEV